MQESQAVFFDIHKPFLGPDHVPRQATDAERYFKPPTMMVGLGQVHHTLQGTACHHGEPYRFWMQWRGQWPQSGSIEETLMPIWAKWS